MKNGNLVILNYHALGFFPFGEGAGDSSMQVTDDNNAVTLFLNSPVVFYNSRQTEIYVSSHECDKRA